MAIKKVFAYQIQTPIMRLGNEALIEEYNNERFEHFLRLIFSKSLEDKAKKFDGKIIWIDYLRDTDDSDFLEGSFIAARYGEEQDIYDVDKVVKTGTKKDREGVVSDVSFVLCKKTGLLLVQSDSNRIISRNTIDKYLSKHQQSVKPFIDKFNKGNKNYHIVETMFYTIQTIVSDDFYEKLSRLSRIKEAKVYIDVTLSEENAALIHYRNEAEEQNVDGYDQIGISLISSHRGTSIRNIRKLFENLIEMEKYDKYEVIGYTNNNNREKVDFSTQPMSFEVPINKNENGLIDKPSLINEMVSIAKHNNPLK